MRGSVGPSEFDLVAEERVDWFASEACRKIPFVGDSLDHVLRNGLIGGVHYDGIDDAAIGRDDVGKGYLAALLVVAHRTWVAERSLRAFHCAGSESFLWRGPDNLKLSR